MPRRRRVQDLAFITGDTEPRPQERHLIVRRGVSVTELPGSGGGRHTQARSSGARLFGPETLLQGDSFAQLSFAQFRPFFADLTFLPSVTTPPDAAARAERFLVQQIRGSELFILLKGERGFWSREPHSVLSGAFLDRLEKVLLPGEG